MILLLLFSCALESSSKFINGFYSNTHTHAYVDDKKSIGNAYKSRMPIVLVVDWSDKQRRASNLSVAQTAMSRVHAQHARSTSIRQLSKRRSVARFCNKYYIKIKHLTISHRHIKCLMLSCFLLLSWDSSPYKSALSESGVLIFFFENAMSDWIPYSYISTSCVRFCPTQLASAHNDFLVFGSALSFDVSVLFSSFPAQRRG